MDIYHVWCDLKPGIGDLDFASRIGAYLGHLKDGGLIEGWRLTRCKLGLSPPGMGEWHIMIETRDMAQLDAAFVTVAGRRDPVEGFHHCVNQVVTRSVFALYRDFPDPFRHYGEERF